MTTQGAALGIDIGGLRIKVVRLVDGEAHDLEIIDLEEKDRSPDGMIQRLTAIVEEMGGKLPIGIGVPGIVRKDGGVVVQSPNFPTWHDFALASRLGDAIGRSVQMDNDANAFLRAECTLGVARGKSHVLGLTLGTGLGGAIWLDGMIYRGARGMAGELGHVPFEPDGASCGCGSRGCIEQYASTQFLSRRAKEIGLSLVAGQPLVRVGRILADAARNGDEDARELFREMGSNLGTAVAGMINLTDVELIVTGGGLSGAYDLFGKNFEAVVRRRIYDAMNQGLSFEVASLKKAAGAVGAALLALGYHDDLTT